MDTAILKNEVDEATVRKLEDLLRGYATEVDASELGSGSKAMYVDFATCFVRWIQGEFQPGSRGAMAELQAGKRRQRERV